MKWKFDLERPWAVAALNFWPARSCGDVGGVEALPSVPRRVYRAAAGRSVSHLRSHRERLWLVARWPRSVSGCL